MSVRNTKQGKDRHGEILDAAARVITERGLAETRVADIADEAGVSAGLILYYFETKDRLLAEALTFAYDRFYLRTSREIRRIPTARERLVRLIDLSIPGLLPEYGRLDEWALWIELWVRALRDPSIGRDRETLDRRWRAQIADVIRDGQTTGEFPDGDADETALRLTALIDGLAIQVVLDDSEVSPQRMRQACLDVAAREIGFEPEPLPGEKRPAGRALP